MPKSLRSPALVFLALFWTGCATLTPSAPPERTSLFGSLGQWHGGWGFSLQNSELTPLFDATSESTQSVVPSAVVSAADGSHANHPANPVPAMQLAANGVYRAQVVPAQAFQLVNRVLAQNYIIARSDPTGLTVATEWDKFFIDGRLFRNRLHIALFSLAGKQTEIVVRNFVEYYASDRPQAAAMEESGWLPCPDITDEVKQVMGRLSQQVSSMAAAEMSSVF